jgi:hypothetical protein
LEHFYPHLVKRLQELDEAVGDSLKAIAFLKLDQQDNGDRTFKRQNARSFKV